MRNSGEAVLEGQVTRVVFQDEETLFASVKVAPEGGGPEVSVIGEFLAVSAGDEFTFTGDWETHPKWGPQLRIRSAQRKLPRQPEAVVAYLGGGLFPGVGPGIARRVVRHFGQQTLDLILASPERIAEVPGIGPKKRERLAAALAQHHDIQELALFLQGHGVTLGLTKKIHEAYGRRALDVVRTDPYRVAREIPGVGFLKADGIARKIGLPADSPARVRASVGYVLQTRCEVRGHTFLPRGDLVRECLGFLNREPGGPFVPAEMVAGAIDALIAEGSLVAEKEAVYLSEVHAAEIELARRLRGLLRAGPSDPKDLDRILAETETEAGVRYSELQRTAIRTALTSPVAIVTGGPGTGKSTIIRAVEAARRRLRRDAIVHLAAPTGRAAKRMAEVTGREAMTIHRLLEFSPKAGVFQRGLASPLEGHLLVVDEASMVDLNLASALFRAVPAEMQVLLVGDADQLPSVGFGNVFADLIQSRAIPVVRLSEIFRQARQSRIVTNAHRVNQGLMPILEAASDWRFVPIADAAKVAQYIRDVAVAGRAKGAALEEINVLTPMRKTEAGVFALNRLLQAALNPPSPRKPEVPSGDSLLRVGDKVMQTRNNYDKAVFNGDLGVIAAVVREGTGEAEVEEDAARVVVDFQGTAVEYDKWELDQLTLAYACTIHKAQGSEYKGIVLVPVIREHYVMLQRNLLYTAITRARERVVLVGQEAAIRRAVTNVGSRLRYSRLAARLTAAR